MRVKFLGVAILALCFFIVGSSTFAKPISKDESARLQSFFKNRFGTAVPPNSEVEVQGFEASPIKGFKEGVFVVSSDGNEQELPFIITDDGKYVLIGKPTSIQSFKPSEVEGIRQGSLPFGPSAVPVLASDNGQYLMLGGQLVSTKNFKDSGFAGFKQGTIPVGRNQVPIYILGDAKYVILAANITDTKDFTDTGVAGLKKGTVGTGRQRITLFVSQDGKYLVLGRPGLSTEIMDSTIDPHQEVMEKISLDNIPTKGAKDAQVTVVEYSDFQCPFCKRGKDMLPDILKQYDGKIKISYKQLPLQIHDWAMKASIASLCAYEQGNDKFWAFHDEIFDNQSKIKLANADETFTGYAKKIGLNTKKFKQCLGSKEIAAKVNQEMKEAQAIGVSSTPTFVIEGMIVPGANPDGVKSAIALKLSQDS